MKVWQLQELFKISLQYRHICLNIPAKLRFFHFALLIFLDTPMLHISSSSITSSSQQKYLCPSTEQIFCFASCICVNNTQKCFNRIGVEENLFSHFPVGFSRSQFSTKIRSFIVACKLCYYFFFLERCTCFTRLVCCFTNFLFPLHTLMKFEFMYFTFRYFIQKFILKDKFSEKHFYVCFICHFHLVYASVTVLTVLCNC